MLQWKTDDVQLAFLIRSLTAATCATSLRSSGVPLQNRERSADHPALFRAPKGGGRVRFRAGMEALAEPRWLEARLVAGGDDRFIVLRWTPDTEPFFYSYKLFVKMGTETATLEDTPFPLRAAMWIYSDPLRSVTREYGVQAISATGMPTTIIWSNPVAS